MANAVLSIALLFTPPAEPPHEPTYLAMPLAASIPAPSAPRTTWPPPHLVLELVYLEPPPTTTAPAPPPSVRSRPPGLNLERLRDCESHGDYGANTGNGYFGAYQFAQGTWDSLAARAAPALEGLRPDLASPADQDAMAMALYLERGPAPWPTCGYR